jgi:hypothetical protein
MQKLQQQLESKFPPELIDAQVRLIDGQIAALEPKNKLANAQAVKTGVDASFSAMQAAEVVAAIPQAAPVADALMQGAGYRLPNPPGVDPNIPTAGTPNTAGAAVAPKGGAGTVEPNEVTGGAQGDTSPNTPAHAGGAGGEPVKPASPGAGAGKGIETERSDSGFRDGGLIAFEDDQGLINTSSRKALASGSIVAEGLSGGILHRFAAQDQAGRVLDNQRALQRAKIDAAAPPPAPPPATNVGLGSGVTTLPYAGFTSAPAPTSIASVAKSTISKPLGSGTFGLDDFTSYADGGQINGPGTGTSDSIPAVTDQGKDIAVSNGEYKIPPQVVQALGKDFFDQLIAQYHTPVQGQAPIYQAKGPMDTPLGMETGSIIIPADVVQALGADFFDRLVQMYGSAQ